MFHTDVVRGIRKCQGDETTKVVRENREGLIRQLSTSFTCCLMERLPVGWGKRLYHRSCELREILTGYRGKCGHEALCGPAEAVRQKSCPMVLAMGLPHVEDRTFSEVVKVRGCCA